MASTIVIKNSSTASSIPATGDLVQGELAVNVTDKKLYTKNGSGTITRIVGSLGSQEASAVAITGGSITGMSSPSNTSDVSTKGYVDGLITTNAGYATAAASSATAAASSATSSAASATLANDWATKTSGTVAGGEYSAKYHANAAATSASNASTSATAAASAQSAAEAARDATLNAYDQFDDRYLGSKTSDPTVDNDGNALVAGSLYYNSVSQVMRLYTGSAWVAAYVSGAGYLASANNLSDLASASTARTNLGVAIGTNVQAYSSTLTSWASKTVPTGTVIGTTDTQTLTNKTITTVALTETKVAVAASAIDLAAGNYFSKTISGTTTFTISNTPSSGIAGSFILDLTNGGSATVNWWSGVKWAGGTAPTLTSSGRDVLGFFTHDGGTTWTGLVLGKDVK